MNPTREEIVAALKVVHLLAKDAAKDSEVIHECIDIAKALTITSWLAARVGEGEPGWRDRYNAVWLGDAPEGSEETYRLREWRSVLVIPLDGGKQTTADEILAKMKPLPQAPDDGGKQP